MWQQVLRQAGTPTLPKPKGHHVTRTRVSIHGALYLRTTMVLYEPHRVHSKKQCGNWRSLATFTYHICSHLCGHHNACVSRKYFNIIGFLCKTFCKGPGILRISLCKGPRIFFLPRYHSLVVLCLNEWSQFVF